MPYKVGLISLGCSKNLVDSENMLYLLDEAGFELTDNIDSADAVVVNTCGFIDEAKSEAIENLLEIAELKKEGKLRAIIATGCLVERYKDELLKEIPEIDALVGCGSYSRIVEAVTSVLDQGLQPKFYDSICTMPAEIGRIPCTPSYTAYVRIAEGCDSHCAYCVIPSLRGPFRSRKFEDIVDECRALAQGGAKELIVIAQDITCYGIDRYGRRRLPELVDALCAIDAVVWVRLHYLNPDGITEELIASIERNPKVTRYLDIPIQHIDDGILAAMNRRYTGAEVRALFADLRRRLPGLVLRTSLIVGLPGENRAKFEALCAFLRESKLERAGVFTYSPQEDTPAASMPGQVSEAEKRRRCGIVSEIQTGIMDEYNHNLIGKVILVLCEGYDRLAEIWSGRTFADSPDVDGKVFFSSEKKLQAGAFYHVLITDVLDGDPLGRLFDGE